MFNRRTERKIEVVKPTMDTGLIGKMDAIADRPSFGALVNAVLFASGELKRIETDSEIYGLVLAGYEGLRFGDDGTYTAYVASELPLERWDGVRRLEKEMNKAVREVNPAYCAEHVEFIALNEAAVHMDIAMKRSLGIAMPSEVSWSNGTLSTGA